MQTFRTFFAIVLGYALAAAVFQGADAGSNGHGALGSGSCGRGCAYIFLSCLDIVLFLKFEVI